MQLHDYAALIYGILLPLCLYYEYRLRVKYGVKDSIYNWPAWITWAIVVSLFIVLMILALFFPERYDGFRIILDYVLFSGTIYLIFELYQRRKRGLRKEEEPI